MSIDSRCARGVVSAGVNIHLAALGGRVEKPEVVMSENWQELLVTDHTIIEKVFAAMNEMFDTVDTPRPETVHQLLEFLTVYVDQCHSKKEEEHLFPLLEARGMPREGGPLAVMLAEHEQSRLLLKEVKGAGRAYIGGDTEKLDELRRRFRTLTELLGQHFWKENDILYPMGMRIFRAEDHRKVVEGIEAVEAALGADTRERYYMLADTLTRALQDLSEGLDWKVLAAILNTLPVELSFVGADDRVAYFSHEDHDKIFPRNRSAIGMLVQDCHPQKSVHLVNRILEDFKSGARDVAEFWIDFKGTKVHIRYFPVRDRDGNYLGTLEVVQDVGGIQALQGERRLLQET